MTAYAPTWTGRLKVSYFGAQAIHTQTWRYPGPSSGSGVTDLIAVVQAFYDACANIMWSDFQINAVSVADINSSVFLPIPNPFTTPTGLVDIADFEAMDKAEVTTFVGRTTGGNPWHISQYGIAVRQIEVPGQLNYRVLASENPQIGTIVGTLQAGAGTVLGNDANTVAFYDYADLKPNDRWVKKIRRGA